MIEDPDSLPVDGEIMEGDFEGAEMIEPEMEGDFFEEELEPVDEGFEEYGGDMIEEDVTFDDAEDLE